MDELVDLHDQLVRRFVIGHRPMQKDADDVKTFNELYLDIVRNANTSFVDVEQANMMYEDLRTTLQNIVDEFRRLK